MHDGRNNTHQITKDGRKYIESFEDDEETKRVMLNTVLVCVMEEDVA